MKYLLTGDLHLTDRVEDEHRWKIWPLLAKTALERACNAIIILGDLTDRKDNHSARLVNRIIQALESMPVEVMILKGNHDYIDQDLPYFHWLTFLNLRRRVTFFSDPSILQVHGSRALILPHTRDISVWKASMEERPKVIFTHCTLGGAISESSGVALDGIPRSALPPAELVISGDIHLPQQVTSDFHYVGSPYHTRFGKNYEPRLLTLDWHGQQLIMESIPTGLARRVVLHVTDPASWTFPADLPQGGDHQYRLVIHQAASVPQEQWERTRDELESAVPGSIVLPSVEPLLTAQAEQSYGSDEELLSGYCSSKGISESEAAHGARLFGARTRNASG